MKKFWRIFGHEYFRHVLRKRFLFGLLSMPVAYVVLMTILFVAMYLSFNRDPVGYIDQSGILKTTQLPQEYRGLVPYEFRAFPDESTARASLAEEEIQAFFVIPATYPDSGEVKLFYLREPVPIVDRAFANLITFNMLDGQPDEVKRYVMRGPSLVIRALQEEEMGETSTLKMVYRMLAPWIVSGFLLIAIMTTSGYLMQSMVDEKENRMMEILVTSMRPEMIMHAKVIAMILVGITQIAAWGLLPGLGVLALSRIPEFAKFMSLDWKTLAFIIATALPTFVMFAAFMAAIGASIAESGQGQAISGLLSLFLYLPYVFSFAIMNQPDGVIAMILSYFPLTASITLLLRMGVATIPDWQIWFSAASVILGAVGSLWIAGRIFRLGMLRYGKPLDFNEVVVNQLPPSTQSWLRRLSDQVLRYQSHWRQVLSKKGSV